MNNFDYVAATSLHEATQLLKVHGGSARLLAGGTDLLINMRVGRRQPTMVIDVKQIPELDELNIDDKGLSIGAAVNCRRIWEDKAIREKYPALVDSAS